MNALQGKRVLIVEDESLVGFMAQEMLQELGATVVALAGSLDQALKAAASASMDVALLDVNLRGHSAAPVAEVLRGRNIPIVFATGYGAPYAVPGNGLVLNKPYTIDMLANALAGALRTTEGKAT